MGQNSDPAKDFLPTLQSAAALGAPLIRIWGGGTASSELDADTRKELETEAKTVSDMAASEGIKVALEWHKNTVTDTNESGLSFLDEAAADNLYCLWQPTVALNMDERCAGLDMLEARDRLLNLHVYYWLEGKRRPFVEGLDEWRRYLQHVNRNEKRYGLLEFVLDNTEEQFLEDAAQWKRLLQETAMN